jgi:S1-C subfamily serine protease
MSAVLTFDIEAYSTALAGLVEGAGQFVAALRPGAYRTSSGVLLGNGLIAANHHVVRRETSIPVQLPDGAEAQANVLGRDPAIDVAILQLQGDHQQHGGAPALESAPLRAGELVAVVGRTLDVGLSASIGILGAVGGSRNTWRGGKLNQFLRLDVNLYPSQAGAAVVSANGGLLGMATGALLRHSALAIPTETLQRVGAELLENGRIRQGYLGVGLQPVPIPEHLRSKTVLAGETGLMVLSVEPGTGADAAGIQLGDILVAAGVHSLSAPELLMAAIGGNQIGQPLRFTVLRAGGVVELDIVVGERAAKG